MRPEPLLELLHSVEKQKRYPDEIIIIDGSTNKETQCTQIKISLVI